MLYTFIYFNFSFHFVTCRDRKIEKERDRVYIDKDTKAKSIIHDKKCTKWQCLIFAQ